MSRRKHVMQLAKELNVKLLLEKGGPPEAWWIAPGQIDAEGGEVSWAGRTFTEPTAWVRDWSPRDQFAYFSALHELGHAASGHTEVRRRSTPVDEVFADEVEAWAWALDHALEEPNSRTLRLIFDSEDNGLGSYIKYDRPSASAVEAATGLRATYRQRGENE